MPSSRILLLGGTAEAAQLAGLLDADPAFDPITSLAGRTADPAAVAGQLRIGGFGGLEALARYLADEAIEALVDATHPFAQRITGNAVTACQEAGVPRLRLERPPWRRQPGDDWMEVDSVVAAAEALAGSTRRVFLSIGRQDLDVFKAHQDIWYLLRMVDPPADPIPLQHHNIVLARGPFVEEAEAELLTRHRIDTVVSRNAGGGATYAKIAAARRLGLPVIMIARPPTPAGPVVDSVEAAIDWLNAVLMKPCAPAAKVD